MYRIQFKEGLSLLRCDPLNFRRIHHISRRTYSWNPFKRTTIDTEIKEPIDDVVLNATQTFRSNPSPDTLRELLLEVNDAAPGKQSFTLMNEIMKKLDKVSSNSLKNESQRSVIPLLSIDETYLIYKRSTQNATTENFTHARFIPRLYLQLISLAKEQNNEDLLLNVFIDFVRYLTKLGYVDQLSKVIMAFFNENSKVGKHALSNVIAELELTDPHPTFFIELYNTFTKLGIKQSKIDSLRHLAIDKTFQYMETRNKLFRINHDELIILKSFLTSVLDEKITPKYLIKTIKLCDGNESLRTEKTNLSLKLNDIILESDKALLSHEDLRAFTREVLPNDFISRSRKVALVKKILSLYNTSSEDALKDQNFELGCLMFRSRSLSDKMKEILHFECEGVDVNTFNVLLFALTSTPKEDLESKIIELEEFFQENFPNVFKDLKSYEILLKLAIQKGEVALTKDLFKRSVEEGISWSESPEVLYEALTLIALDPNGQPEEVFSWYKKVKFFVPYLDAVSYSAMMKMFLKFDYIADVGESLKRELPELSKGEKFKVENYPELFEIIYRWFLEDSKLAEDAWEVYGHLHEHFHLPFDTYFPIMKRLNDLGRPDASFLVFQQLKKLHRTEGQLPPPTPEMYVYLFKNFGRSLYEEGVENLHMILKMDLHINSDVRIMNAVMDAYCNLQDFDKVTDIYNQILTIPNKSGLNHETVSIMLKTYTFLSLDLVKNFWNNLDELQILPNSNNFNQYIISHCYHGEFQQALEIASSMEHFDIPVEPETIKLLYTWANNQDDRKLVDNWAVENHHPLFQKIKDELLSIGSKDTENSGNQKETNRVLDLVRQTV